MKTWWHLKYEYRMVKLFHLLLLIVLPYWKVVITYVPKTRNRTVVNNLVLYFTFCSSGYQHQWLFKSKYYAWVWWEMIFSFERCNTRGWHLFLLGVKVLVMLCKIWLFVCSEFCIIVRIVYLVCVICICSICCRFVSFKVIYRECWKKCIL